MSSAFWCRRLWYVEKQKDRCSDCIYRNDRQIGAKKRHHHGLGCNLDHLRPDYGGCQAPCHYVGNGLRPERFGRRVGGSEAIETLGGHVDSCKQRANQENCEALGQQAVRAQCSAESAAQGANQESCPAAMPLHQCGKRRCGKHRAENDQRNRQRGKADVWRKRLAGQAAKHENHRHLRSKQSLRQNQYGDVAPCAPVRLFGSGLMDAGHVPELSVAAIGIKSS